MPGPNPNPLSGLNRQEHASWLAIQALSPRQLAHRLRLSVHDAMRVQQFAKVMLEVHQRIHARRPLEDLERKACSIVSQMSTRVKQYLFDDNQIKRYHDALNDKTKPLVTLK